MLPARFPNLLVNGSQGIAVGMATNIPPHNLGEVIDATLHLIDNPEATPDDLMQFVKGPDFPTGGSILGRAGIIDAYRTGPRQREDAGHGQRSRRARTAGYEIVVTELPYQTSCSAIAGRIQELVDGGDLDGIADVNDGSAGGKTNLVITLKRDANANVVLNNLFKLTQLQTSFAINMVALVDGVPRTLNLAQALHGYVATRSTSSPAARSSASTRPGDASTSSRAASRRSTSSTRSSPSSAAATTPAAAKAGLMAAPFEFSEIQADRHPRHAAAPAHPAQSRIDLETELDRRARHASSSSRRSSPTRALLRRSSRTR